jgi:hypothetical protein
VLFAGLCNTKEKDMLYRTFLTAAVIAALGGASTIAQAEEMDAAQMCSAAADAYQAYKVNNTDPDLESADRQVTEGVTDCKNRQFDSGLHKINEATARIHDHVKTK